MSNYGHDLLFGTFVTPTNQSPQHAVEQAIVAEEASLDLVTFQDHPYQPSFHDTWTLLSYVAARTERIRLSANVHCLPLRPPAVLARAAASLDLLTGGRIELGLGAGAFWDGIVAMGGPRRTPGESITALEEAVTIIRGIWDAENRDRLVVDGEQYAVDGAKRGPAPAHPIGIWLGAYKPRSLRLTGRTADGWLPSLSYLPNGPSDLAQMNDLIDQGAERAGRHPSAVRRLLNIDAKVSVEQLTEIALTYGTSGFILASDHTDTTKRFAAEVAPAVRAGVAAERG